MIEKSLREMGECLPGMPLGKRPKEDEVSPQVRRELRVQ